MAAGEVSQEPRRGNEAATSIARSINSLNGRCELRLVVESTSVSPKRVIMVVVMIVVMVIMMILPIRRFLFLFTIRSG